MATHNVCSFFKFGFCKHGDFCKNYHEKRICENEACNILMCSLRHPRICRFFKEYKRCKFDPCAYKHEDSDIIIRSLKEENKAILVKLENLSKDIEILNEKERDSEEMIENLKHFDSLLKNKNEKIEALEGKLKDTNLKVLNRTRKLK